MDTFATEGVGSSAASSSGPTIQEKAHLQFGVWFPLALVLAAILGAIAAHAPARVKLVGLFAVGVGVLAGTALAYAGRALHIVVSRTHQLALGLCILTALAVATAEAYRLHLQFWDDHFQSIPMSGQLTEFTPEQIAAMPRESREVAMQIRGEMSRRRELLSFPGFLSHRLPEGMSHWAAPWPTVWWLAEIIFATVAGLITAVRLLKGQSPASELAVEQSPH